MNTAPSACDLTRRDLMDMDALLMQELGKFIQCSHHALYFPTTHAPRQPELLPRERRLLLPLYRQGSLLGVLMLHGVKVRDARVLLPQLPAIADLCLELLARVKATRVDAVTGLATENVLYGSMEDEAARVREIFADPSRGDGQSSPLHRLCMGLVLLHFSNGREIVGRMGFRFADELMRRAAEALQEELPSDVVAARVGRFGMALLLPSVSGRSACQKMAEAALARMAGAAMPAPLTGRTIRPRLSAGHARVPAGHGRRRAASAHVRAGPHAHGTCPARGPHDLPAGSAARHALCPHPSGRRYRAPGLAAGPGAGGAGGPGQGPRRHAFRGLGAVGTGRLRQPVQGRSGAPAGAGIPFRGRDRASGRCHGAAGSRGQTQPAGSALPCGVASPYAGRQDRCRRCIRHARAGRDGRGG